MSDNSPQISHSPSLESPFSKYLREYRLLNSLFNFSFRSRLSFTLLWNIVVWVAPSGEPRADFSDAGKQFSSSKTRTKVRLMQRQKQAKPYKPLHLERLHF